jgi:hypothetical protein
MQAPIFVLPIYVERARNGKLFFCLSPGSRKDGPSCSFVETSVSARCSDSRLDARSRLARLGGRLGDHFELADGFLAEQ